MSSTISRAMLKNSAAPKPTAAEGRAGTEREPTIVIRAKKRSSASGALFKWTLGMGILAMGAGYYVAGPWQASRPVPPPSDLAIAPPPADTAPALPVISVANGGGGLVDTIEAAPVATPMVIRIEIVPQPAMQAPVVTVETPRPPALLIPPPALPPAIPPVAPEVGIADNGTSPTTAATNLLNPTGVQLRTSTAQVMAKYKVSGIFWSQTDPVAFINDTIVELGQTLDEITLIRVEKTYIVVEYYGTEVTLRP